MKFIKHVSVTEENSIEIWNKLYETNIIDVFGRLSYKVLFTQREKSHQIKQQDNKNLRTIKDIIQKVVKN